MKEHVHHSRIIRRIISLSRQLVPYSDWQQASKRKLWVAWLPWTGRFGKPRRCTHKKLLILTRINPLRLIHSQVQSRYESIKDRNPLGKNQSRTANRCELTKYQLYGNPSLDSRKQSQENFKCHRLHKIQSQLISHRYSPSKFLQFFSQPCRKCKT